VERMNDKGVPLFMQPGEEFRILVLGDSELRFARHRVSADCLLAVLWCDISQLSSMLWKGGLHSLQMNALFLSHNLHFPPGSCFMTHGDAISPPTPASREVMICMTISNPIAIIHCKFIVYHLHICSYFYSPACLHAPSHPNRRRKRQDSPAPNLCRPDLP